MEFENLFKTYQANSKQHVTANGQTTDNSLIQFRVQQGSGLGPLLILI